MEKIKNKLSIKRFRLFKTVFLGISFTSYFIFSSCTSINEYTHITKIIDGDTFEDKNNVRYRLLGVDTPESFDSSNNFKPTIGIQKFYATKATNLSSETIFNKNVIIKNWKIDTYKRMVSRVSYGKIELSKLLLTNGLARVKYISPIKGDFFYYPNIDYYNQLIEMENCAKLNKIGVWSLSEYDQKIVFPK